MDLQVVDPMTANSEVLDIPDNVFTLSNVLFVGSGIFNFVYYYLMMLQPCVEMPKEREVNLRRDALDWIKGEMICHHIFCTIFTLAGWNVPLLFANVAIDIYNLWWWFIVRLDDNEKISCWLAFHFILYSVCMIGCPVCLVYCMSSINPEQGSAFAMSAGFA